MVDIVFVSPSFVGQGVSGFFGCYLDVPASLIGKFISILFDVSRMNVELYLYQG